MQVFIQEDRARHHRHQSPLRCILATCMGMGWTARATHHMHVDSTRYVNRDACDQYTTYACHLQLLEEYVWY